MLPDDCPARIDKSNWLGGYGYGDFFDVTVGESPLRPTLPPWSRATLSPSCQPPRRLPASRSAAAVTFAGTEWKFQGLLHVQLRQVRGMAFFGSDGDAVAMSEPLDEPKVRIMCPAPAPAPVPVGEKAPAAPSPSSAWTPTASTATAGA